jgi:ubiquinone/menaquinone biosynthesis C-methylase UbiE
MGKIVVVGEEQVSQCQKPRGWLGRLTLWNMNSRHSKVTDWGLSHVTIEANFYLLDVGCGGGRTLDKLATVATQGKVFGIDYSPESVAVAKKTNQHWIPMGRVEIKEGSVSELPFADNTFDLVTAVETHFWWPDLPRGMSEIFRVLKPGGKLLIVAEMYKGSGTRIAKLAEKHVDRLKGMKLLDAGDHRALFVSAKYLNVEIYENRDQGWICGVGTKPMA